MRLSDAVAERVLVLAPTGRDAALTCRVLEDHGLPCLACHRVGDLDRELERGGGVLVLGEEALEPETTARLMVRLGGQPVWSDLPVILLARALSSGDGLLEALGPRANVTVLDRPVRIATLLTTVHAALRARRQQYEVRDLVDQLAEQDRQKDEFLAVLGHELRNPLGAISTAVTVLSRDGLPDEPRRRQTAVIERQVRQVARMLDDLLDLSRLNLGKIRIERRQVELQSVIDGAVETLDGTGQLAARDVRMRVPEKPLTVMGDPVRLEQVVVNLLQNAVRHTPEGGKVELSLDRSRGEAFLRMRDEGVGLAPEDLSAIFEPFRQLDVGGSSPGVGFGVGLFLSRQIVELHGGRLEAASEGSGRGSVFTVTLPLATRGVRETLQSVGRQVGRAVREAGSGGEPAGEPPEEPTAGGVHVLLVEDHASGREALEELLSLWGCRVRTAETGAEALAQAREDAPDLVLVDIGLPDMDGYEVARRLRENLGERTGRLVAVTGFGQPEDRRRALEAGFDEHLVKPVDPARLEGVLRGSGGAAGDTGPHEART